MVNIVASRLYNNTQFILRYLPLLYHDISQTPSCKEYKVITDHHLVVCVNNYMLKDLKDWIINQSYFSLVRIILSPVWGFELGSPDPEADIDQSTSMPPSKKMLTKKRSVKTKTQT